MDYSNLDIISSMLLNPGTYELEIDDDFLIGSPMINVPIISATISDNAAKYASMTIIDCTPADNSEINVHSIGTYTGKYTIGWYNSTSTSAYIDGDTPIKKFDNIQKNKDILSSRIIMSNSISSFGLNDKDDNNQNTYIRQVKISKKIKKLEDYCFCNSNYLTSFFISNNKNEDATLEIGNFAFANCKNLLGKAIIPIQTTKIGAGAFANCEKLYSVVIFNKCKTIEKGAFYGTKLKYIILQNRLQYNNIAEWFQKPDNLPTQVEYENNIKRDDKSKYPLSNTEIEAFNEQLEKNINVTRSSIEGYYDKAGNWVDLTDLSLNAYLDALDKIEVAIFQNPMPLKALMPCTDDSYPYGPTQTCDTDSCFRDRTDKAKCSDYVCTQFTCNTFACDFYFCNDHLCFRYGCITSDAIAPDPEEACRVKHVQCKSNIAPDPFKPPKKETTTPKLPKPDGPAIEDIRNMSNDELLNSEGIEA